MDTMHATHQWYISKYSSGDCAIVDEENGRDVAIVRDAAAEYAALMAAAPRLLEACQKLVATLEGAWAEKQLTAPRYVQCQLSTEVRHAKAAIADATRS